MDKLIFKVSRPKTDRCTNVVRISTEAMDCLEEISSKTGKTLSFIASEMIKFACKNCEIKYEEE